MDIWSLVIDAGIACTLLLIAKLLRANIKILQRLFIPTALIAGLLGLGTQFIGLPGFSLSEAAQSYGGVLICLIFSAVGLSTQFPKLDELIHRTGRLWAFNQLVILCQWIVAILFGLLIVPMFFPDLPSAFGLIFPAGFMGGHGTAAALGTSLTDLGWEDALSLGLTSATVGVFLSVLGGMAIVNIFARIGLLKDVQKFEQLDVYVRRGLTDPDNRSSIGEETVESASMHTLTLHLALIGCATVLGYYLATYGSSLGTHISVPVFACCFLVGCIMRAILKSTGVLHHFDEKLISSGAGVATDFLIFFGISTIKLSVLLLNSIPFIVIMVLGLVTCLVLTLVVAPVLLDKDWAKRSVFSWGWMTGTVALGILLLRVSDPKSRSHVLDDFAISYVPVSVVDILLISFVPGFLMMGHAGTVLGVLSGGVCFVLLTFFTLIHRRSGVS